MDIRRQVIGIEGIDIRVWSVIGLNCLLAGLVFWLAYRLWRWRCQLAQLNAERVDSWLQAAELPPQQMGYALMLSRAHLVQTRLSVAQVRLRSRQVHQIFQLIRLLRIVLLYRRSL